MAFQAERHFNLLCLEEGEEYVADVSATMVLFKRDKRAESKGRLRICSKSLIFQPVEVSAAILKFPYRYLRRIGDVDEKAACFAIDCEQLVQVATKMVGPKTRIVAPFSIVKTKMTVNFIVSYANAGEYVTMIRRLSEAASMSFSPADNVVKQILSEATGDVEFDLSRLGHRETALLPQFLWVRRVKPLLQVRGMLQVSNAALYFQPHPNFSSKPVKQLALADVLHVFHRTYGIQANALEIITVHGKCMYLCFETQRECERVAQILQEQRQELTASGASVQRGPLVASLGAAEDNLSDIHKITALWQSGLLSNFHYLDFLNCAAGRSQNDFSQYPVFPWVLKDYTSDTLNLSDPAVFRDLTKPIGALNPKRLAYFQERMEGMGADEQFLYGTHYSTPAYVIYWLLRAMPERMLRLHTGHFDAMPRLFRSVGESWDSVNESTASLMELIPEFFVLPGNWLENSLAIVTAEGPLPDIQLPRWAAGIDDFICKMRAALESDYVSHNLPAWIDLIFGCKQSGEEALKADNLFHPVCYTGCNHDRPVNKDLPREVVECQLQEFGRVPRQLFSEPHPPRLKIPRWEPGRLREDKMESEPWYKAVRHVSSREVESVATPARSEPSAGYAPSSPSSAQAAGSSQPLGVRLKALTPRPVAPLVASGCITGVASCVENLYAIGEDGCLRVSPLSAWLGSAAEADDMAMRRNFRISPMPLSALTVIRTDLLAIGGHDNAVTLYSSSCGSALSKCQVHADTVTCLGVSPCGGLLASGSSDQSLRTWAITPTSLKNEGTFDDIQQPITCCAQGRNVLLAGADDGQLMAWDARSGQPVLERELGGAAVACALHEDERLAAALDSGGELRLFDLRMRCETVRLGVAAQGGLSESSCFLTDFSGWAILGGTNLGENPVVTLWDIPEQRQLCTWELAEDRGGFDARFLVELSGLKGGTGPSLLSASANGAVNVFT